MRPILENATKTKWSKQYFMTLHLVNAHLKK